MSELPVEDEEMTVDQDEVDLSELAEKVTALKELVDSSDSVEEIKAEVLKFVECFEAAVYADEEADDAEEEVVEESKKKEGDKKKDEKPKAPQPKKPFVKKPSDHSKTESLADKAKSIVDKLIAA